MSNVEWFRRTAWSDVDREEFNAKLNRSRGAGNKAQYLRIQAGHLAQSGYHDDAIELLNRLLREFPERMELAQAHAQKAESLARLGQLEDAINEYRAALQAERDFPTVQTNAWLDFGWLVVERQLTDLYDEATKVSREFRKETDLKLPVIEYRYAVIQTLLADARGEEATAQEFAKRALAEAAKVHSGLPYHPAVGRVGPEQSNFDSRLRALAGS